MTEERREELRNHNCREAGEYAWWEYDGRGIELCKVCAKCVKVKLAGYRPEIVNRRYTAADVHEPIEEEEW